MDKRRGILPSSSASSTSSHPAIIVFSAPLTRHLSTSAARLPGTYVGVRRVRPSSRNVHRTLTTAIAEAPAVSSVVYKIVDPKTGIERRMTSKEKKELKFRLRKEKNEQKKATKVATSTVVDRKRKDRLETTEQMQSVPPSAGNYYNDDCKTNSIVPSTTYHHETGEGGDYVEMKVDSSALEEELADLRGERDGVPPVILAPSMAVQALRNGILLTTTTTNLTRTTSISDSAPSSSSCGGAIRACHTEKSVDDIAPGLGQTQTNNNVSTTAETDTASVVDDESLAAVWAAALKKSMAPAERQRQQEDMRPMPYELVPEAWSRMRPASTIITKSTSTSTPKMKINDTTPMSSASSKPSPPPTTTTTTTMIGDEISTTSPKSDHSDGACLNDRSNNGGENNKISSKQTWAFCQTRPTGQIESITRAAIVQLLHQGSHLHLSCGAKFGCDYLLYDGPRQERHAFAGLRVVLQSYRERSSNDTGNEESNAFPTLSAYDLAGYVRCLNNAGKLALLATVVQDGPVSRVAIIDLALKKVIPTSSKRSNKTLEHRYKTLAKK